MGRESELGKVMTGYWGQIDLLKYLKVSMDSPIFVVNVSRLKVIF
jgi:hypothetical protein